MIDCTPLGLCSWDFQLQTAENSAVLEYSWLTETGSISTNHTRYEVDKLGAFSGTWNLLKDNKPLMQAVKNSAFSRSFTIRYGRDEYHLAAESAFGRTMNLDGPNGRAVIAPKHAFTRRATITGSLPPFEVSALTFWLVGLLWRRAQNASSS